MNKRQRKKKTKRDNRRNTICFVKGGSTLQTKGQGNEQVEVPVDKDMDGTAISSSSKLNVMVWSMLNVLLVILVTVVSWVTALLLHAHIGIDGYLADFLLIVVSVICNFQSLLSGNDYKFEKESVFIWRFWTIIGGIICYILYLLIFTKFIVDSEFNLCVYIKYFCIFVFGLVSFCSTYCFGKEVSSKI